MLEYRGVDAVHWSIKRLLPSSLELSDPPEQSSVVVGLFQGTDTQVQVLDRGILHLQQPSFQ